MFIILFAFLFILGPLSGSMSDRFGARWLCLAGMVFLGGALFWFSRLSITANFFQIAGGMGLAGMGLAIFMPPNNAVALSCVPAALRGVAAGVVATARNVGMIVGVTIAGLIFNATFQKLSGGLSFKEYRPELGAFFIDRVSPGHVRQLPAGCGGGGVGVFSIASGLGSDNATKEGGCESLSSKNHPKR